MQFPVSFRQLQIDYSVASNQQPLSRTICQDGTCSRREDFNVNQRPNFSGDLEGLFRIEVFCKRNTFALRRERYEKTKSFLYRFATHAEADLSISIGAVSGQRAEHLHHN